MLVQLTELLDVLTERAVAGVLLATAPKFVGWSVKENDGKIGQSSQICGLGEGSTAESEDARTLKLRQRLFQSVVFGAAERGLAGFSENLRDRAAFAAFNAVVEVFKSPAELPGECLADGSFACAHEADEDDDCLSFVGRIRCRHSSHELLL